MGLSDGTKNRLNEQLRVIVGDATVRDYIDSRTEMDRVLTALATDGWAIRGNNADWSLATVCQLRRKYVVTETRSPDHQARAESRGEVAAGDNTYERGKGSTRIFSTNQRTARASDPGSEQVANMLESLAMAAVEVAKLGARPATRVRDL